MRRRTVMLWMLLVLICAPARAQTATIFGFVTDADSGEPLPDANVFINQTTLGAAADDVGRYEIGPLQPGSYQVVVSVVGYDVASTSVIVVPERDAYRADVVLTPSVVEIEEVVVEGERPREWQRNLRLFEEAFVGTSENAAATILHNPYQLDFETIGGNLIARAAEPLELENRALGYRLTVYMTYFNAGRWVSMGAAVQFEELEPDDPGEAQAWRKRRAETYDGSLTHLLKSLVAGTTRQEGFFVAHDVMMNFRMRRRLELCLIPFIEATDRPYLYRLFFEYPLYIEHGREISWLIMQADDAIVHEDGYVYTSAYDIAPISAHGEIGKGRMADMLPRDYQP